MFLVKSKFLKSIFEVFVEMMLFNAAVGCSGFDLKKNFLDFRFES